MKRLAIALVLALIVAACGGSDSGSDAEPDESPAPTAASTQDTQAPTDEPEPEEEPAEEPADEPAPTGDIAITITIGAETWEFPGALCAFTDAPPGEDGSEWNASYVEGGLQVYLNFDSFLNGDVTIADIENGGNPTVSWEAFGDALDMSVSGLDVTGTGTFTDNVNGGTAEGTFEAHCNDWFDAT